MHRTAAIVCGAGVSSTFLARAVRDLANENGLEWQVEPLAEDQVANRADSLGLVLVGHHLAHRLDDLRLVVASNGVPVVVLDSDDLAAAAHQSLTLLQSHDAERADGANRPSKGSPHG